jgi:hypothetical protein
MQIITSRQAADLLEDGEPIATIIQTNACRGDGGCGSAGIAPEPLAPAPSREPDLTFNLAVPENAALLYRLNGDVNPLHADPAAAGRAGFPVRSFMVPAPLATPDARLKPLLHRKGSRNSARSRQGSALRFVPARRSTSRSGVTASMFAFAASPRRVASRFSTMESRG